jgi:CheY-like chemotaxis protein
MGAKVAVVVEDLFFLAKIRETAKVVGITVVTPDLRRGPGAVGEAAPAMILLDLNARGISMVEWVQSLKSDPATADIPIVGFVSHVQEEVITAARSAGCDTVMARSAFTQRLPEILRSVNDGVKGDG